MHGRRTQQANGWNSSSAAGTSGESISAPRRSKCPEFKTHHSEEMSRVVSKRHNIYITRLQVIHDHQWSVNMSFSFWIIWSLLNGSSLLKAVLFLLKASIILVPLAHCHQMTRISIMKFSVSWFLYVTVRISTSFMNDGTCSKALYWHERNNKLYYKCRKKILNVDLGCKDNLGKGLKARSQRFRWKSCVALTHW